jgi:hypothetical protein
MTRLLIAAGALAVAAVLFLVLRPDDNGGSVATTSADTTTPTTTVPPPPPRPPSPPPPARIRIVVRDGQPVGGVRRVTVAKGRRVVLVVSADVTDHVHVAPGRPARFAFRATIVGTVEVELEDRRLPIARVTAKP